MNNIDMVNTPPHYTDGRFEVIDMMQSVYGAKEVIIFCELNAFKYRMRAGKKDATKIEEDIKKASWYEAKAKQLRQQTSNDSPHEPYIKEMD